MTEPAFPPLRIEPPRAAPMPLVYDSPHSGSVYPPDFGFAIDPMVLRRSEDAHIDELYAHVVEQGATLLHAQFPRAYIDVNRDETDLDVEMLDGVWPHPVRPTSKTLVRGVGLIWRQVKAQGAIYDRKLGVAETAARIERYWRPYHDALEALLAEAQSRFGVAYHVDCHSMSSVGDHTTEDGAVRRPDFVIGDRDGTTCEPGLTACVVETLRGLGYSVAVNDPYKGFELVRRHGRPAEGRHAIQIEVSRGLYMDEATLAKSPDFAETETALRTMTRAIADYVRARA